MAAIDFPASPTNGQLFVASNGVTYEWAAQPGAWLAVILNGGSSIATPGCAVATLTSEILVSAPLVTEQAYMIREAMQTYKVPVASTTISLGTVGIVAAVWTPAPIAPAVGVAKVTYTTSAPHGYLAGQTVTVAGATPSTYNFTAVAASGTTGTTLVLPRIADPGVYVSGGTATGTFSDGPFTPTAIGSGVVIAALAGHGRVAGNTVRFTGIRTTGHGVAVVNDTVYTIINATADEFTFNTGGSATDLLPFGGNGVPQPSNGDLLIFAWFQTVSIRLQHAPVIVPTTLDVHIDCGINGLTQGAHPAESPFVRGGGGVPVHTPWAVIPGLNQYWFELVGSTWVPDSVFLEGHCYVPGTPFDASVEINRLLEACRASGGPSVVQLPPGMMFAKDEVIRVPEGCTFRGYGMRVTGIFWADRAHATGNKPAHVLETGAGSNFTFRNIIGTTIEELSIYGNRTRQEFQVGTHAVALGGADKQGSAYPGSLVPATQETGVIHSKFTVRRMGVFGSSGYGIAMQGNGSKQDVEFESIRVAGSDNDGYDYKDRPDSNDNIQFLKCDTYHWALGDIGTDLRPPKALPPNPITTTVGSKRFSIPRQPNPAFGYTGLLTNARGQVAELTGTGSFNGIALNGIYHCVALTGTEVILESPVAASASGVGGGANMTVLMRGWSNGDVAFDCRSRNTRLDSCYAEGWLLGRSGFRQRAAPGHLADPTPIASSPGSGCWVADGCQVRDTSPEWMLAITEPTGGTAFAILGNDATLINPVFWGMGLCSGMLIRSSTFGSQIVAPRIVNTRIGIIISGEKVQLMGGVVEDYSEYGVLVHGGVVGESQNLPENPFAPVALGSDLVLVLDPLHGMRTGQKAVFTGFIDSPTNGLLIDNNPAVSITGTYIITVIDPDTYTIVVARSDAAAALNLEPWGGENVIVTRPADSTHPAHDIHISDVVTRNTDPTNFATGWEIGTDAQGADFGQVDDLTLVDCHDRGSFKAFVGYGTNINLGPGNTGGIPNVPSIHTNKESPCWELVAEVVVNPTRSMNFIDFQNLDYPNIRVELLSHSRTGTNNTQLYVSTDNCTRARTASGDSGYAANTTSVGNTGVIVTGSSAAGILSTGQVEITNFNSPKRSYFWVDGAGDNVLSANPIKGVCWQTGPRAVFNISGGTVGAGNRIDSIIVGGVDLLAGVPIAFTVDPAAMATAVAAQINLNTATTQFSAATTGSTSVRIRHEAPTEDAYTKYNNAVGAIAVTGDVRLSTIAPLFDTTVYNALRLDTEGSFDGGTFRVYQKGG